MTPSDALRAFGREVDEAGTRVRITLPRAA
jgi:hypothetical protein